MVWGGISLDDRTNLQVIDRGSLIAVRYRDEVILSQLRDLSQVLWGQISILIHDNARAHNQSRHSVPGSGRHRWRAILYIKPCTSKKGSFNISNIGVRLWNNLNENIRTSSSVNLFKKKIKNMFINTYSN